MACAPAVAQRAAAVFQHLPEFVVMVVYVAHLSFAVVPVLPPWFVARSLYALALCHAQLSLHLRCESCLSTTTEAEKRACLERIDDEIAQVRERVKADDSLNGKPRT